MITIAAFYRFVPLSDVPDLQGTLADQLNDHGLRGTILVAPEGINGTIAGDPAAIERFFWELCTDPRFSGMEIRRSVADAVPFLRAKVKSKREIVTLGEDVDAQHGGGTRVAPEAWNALIEQPDVLLIDTRNDYEVAVGTFEGATNPGTGSFRDFPDWAQSHLAGREQTPIAMFCTGGIRCEKSTAYLRAQGFENVYQLDGGILNYLATVDPDESRWQGECFVFDTRVSVGADLRPGSYDQCHACRHPISAEDKADPRYVPGVSCPHCAESTSRVQKARFAERQQQMELAEHRGEAHIGTDATETASRNRASKDARRDVPRGGR